MDLYNAALATSLLVALPVSQIWKSRRRDAAPDTALRRISKYLRSMAEIVLLLGALLFCAWHGGWSATDLGLEFPLSSSGKWGVLFALMLLPGLQLAAVLTERRHNEAQRIALALKLEEHKFLPRTAKEFWIFALLALCMGAGWELLYRSFLLHVLVPEIGSGWAIVLSALAYGLAHGYQNPKQLIGSLVSALLFAIGYAATHSLWWLMVIHVGLPLLGARSSVMAAKRSTAVAAQQALASVPAH
jgi:membrane protease YdiL (CAAX protease family)